MSYSLNDFYDIANTSKYILPNPILDIIDILTKRYSYEKKPVKNRGGFTKPVENDELFKPTVIQKLEGPDKLMNDIRSSINKMSSKNYDLNKSNIIELLAELIEQQDAVNTIASNIFDIASTNKFFSELYAKLYKDISEKFPQVFNSLLEGFLDGFTKTMEDIKYVDQNDDFDAFCDYNKKNDKRRATSMFITNLVKYQVIQPEILISIIQRIQETLKQYMNKDKSVNEVEEIIENLFILITNNTEFMKNYITEEYLHTILEISKSNAKQIASVSSRAIFKAMDIISNIKR